jgi:hypothetical protein
VALCGDMWDQTKRFALGEEILLWPSYLNYSAKKWREELDPYCRQAAKACSKTLFINSLSTKPKALGGCYYFVDGTIKKTLLYGNDGLLIVDL